MYFYLVTTFLKDNIYVYIFSDFSRVCSGFSSKRITLSPFTKDVRGEEQSNEPQLNFWNPFIGIIINTRKEPLEITSHG